jgi:hypothetical protein
MEQPEQLGATFLADAGQLALWIDGAVPVEDDHPHRLSPRAPRPDRQAFIERWMNVDGAAARFAGSAMVQALWPPALREASRPLFPVQRLVNAVMSSPPRRPGFEALRDLLTDTNLRTLPLLVAGSSPVLQDIAQRAWAKGVRSPALQAQIAVGLLARRDHAGAAALFGAAAAPGGADATTARLYQAFALLMADEPDAARAALAAAGAAPPADPAAERDLRWLRAMLAPSAE